MSLIKKLLDNELSDPCPKSYDISMGISYYETGTVS